MDTDVLIAAIRSPRGASAELLRRVLNGGPTLLASVPLFLEYEAVAMRREHLDAAGATEAEVQNLLDVLAGIVKPVELHFLWRPQLRDPDDELVLEAAVNGRAEAIVTFNRRDLAPASQYGIRLLLPREALVGA